jgi:hypothetical protein
MQNDQSLRGAADGVPRCRNYRQMTVTEQGLVLGAGILLAKMGEDGLCLDGEEERILTLLAIAYRGDVPGAKMGIFRRVSKHWQGGDKCLAAILLAQSGLPEIDEDVAYRLSLAARLIDAGVTPRELPRELGLNPVQLDVSKYDENQPRVPAGNGRESGQWTSGGASGPAPSEGRSAGATSTLVEGRSAGTNADEPKHVRGVPKDAIVVTRPDGTAIDDPASPTGKLMAPQRANFKDVYAAGERIANWPLMQQIDPARIALQQFGIYDFQRDKATNSFFDEYVPAANYVIGVYMAGASYSLAETYAIAQGHAMGNSSNWYKYWTRGRHWIESGWEDGHAGYWKTK